MKGDAWAKRFHKEFRRLRVAFGLMEWNFTYRTEKGDGTNEAMVSYDVSNRECVVYAYTIPQFPQPPERVARHEIYHVLLADWSKIVAIRGNDEHPDAMREEHKVIERLLNESEDRT